MAGVQTSAIRVEAPLNRLNKQIQAGRLSWRQFGQTMRNSSRLIAENNALLRAQARSFIDASGNAQVYLNVVRGAAAGQATLNQRLRLGVTAARAFGKQMVATGKNVQWAGRQVMIGLSLPLAMIGALAARGAEEFDKQMTRMVKVTNLSAVGVTNAMGEFVETFQVGSEEMGLAIDSIERQADRLAGIGASMGFMANETAKLAAEFSQMGFAGVQLDALTTTTLRLARVSGADLPDAMNLTRLAAMAFGKQLGDGPGGLTETFARLNMIENRTSLSLNEMAGAIPIVAGVAKNLNIEIETLGGMLALMKDKGIAAREGATSLRTGLIRLVQDATDPAIAAFEKLNINITELQEMNRGNVFGLITDLSHLLHDLQNSGQEAAEKTELFIAAIGKMVGTRAAARFTSMLEGIGRDVEMYTEVVNGFEVTQFRFIEGVDQAGDAFRALSPALMDSNAAMRQFLFEEERVNTSLAGTAEILRAELNLELRRLGRHILPIRNAMVGFARDVVRAFNSVSERTRRVVGSFLLLVGILGPVTMILGVMLNAFGQVIQLFARMLPGIKLTTAAMEAERKAFDRNTTAVFSGTTAKQAMIQTNAALTTSAATVTAAVSAQAAAYGALTAAMAGAMGRSAAAAQFGAPASGAVAVNRATAATRRPVRVTQRDAQGNIIRDAQGNPVTAPIQMPVRSATSPTGFRTPGGQFAADPGIHRGTRNALGEAVLPAAMIASMTLPQIMALPARRRFNPTAGMQGGHAEAIRSMLTREALMGQMRGANAEQLLARSVDPLTGRATGMAPIDAIRHHAVREATASYEREAARAAVAGRKAPTIESFMRGHFGRGAVDSAVARAATEGVTAINPRTGVKTTQFAAQPMALREMTGMGQRLSDRTIVNLSREQRTMLQSRFGVQTGGRVEIGRLERQVASSRGSTSAFHARNMIESMVHSGEVRATHAPVTRQDIVARDRAMARRQLAAAVAARSVADTPQARAAFLREATPMRSRDTVEGRAARTRDTARGAREALIGRRPAETAGQKGLAAGRNAALNAMMMPLIFMDKGLKLLVRTLFGVVPVFRLVSNILLGTTVPAIQIFGKTLFAAVAGMTALISGMGKLTAGILANVAGRAMNMGRRGFEAVRSRMVLDAVSPRTRLARDASGRFISPPAPRAAPGGFVATPLTTGRFSGRAGGAAGRAIAGAGSLIGSTAMGIGSMFIPRSVRAAAGRIQQARQLPGGRQRSTLDVGRQAFRQSGFGRGFRDASDAAILGRNLPPGTSMGPRGRQAAQAARERAGLGQRMAAGAKGLRGGLMGMGGMKGSLAQFALGSVGGAAATLAIPIVLTMFGAAIANPKQFMDALKTMMGPAVETLKRTWDGLVQTFRRLRETLSGGGDDADSFGAKMSKWAGIITGVIGGFLVNVLNVALGLVRGIVNVFNGIFQWLQGDGAGAAESFGMAWRSVWGSLLEGIANFFDMLRDIPIIGKLFGAVADRARGWAEETNNALAAMELIPNAIAEVNRGLRQTRGLMEENQKEIEDIEKIVSDLAEFDLVDPAEIDRLTEMVTVTAEMAEWEVDQRERNVAAVYDQLVAMEHLTDEQITQIGQLIMRRRAQSELARLENQQQELQLILQQAENDGHEEIISSQLAQLRLTTVRAQMQNELNKAVEDQNTELINSLAREAAEIESTNRQRVSRAGLDAQIAQTQEEIEATEARIAGITDEVNRNIANRKQAIEANSQATQEQADEMERLADEAERAKREIQAIRSAMGEVMGDITGVVSDMIRNQSNFIKDYFSDLENGAKDYFDAFNAMFDDQTDIMLEEIERRAELELEMIDGVADAAIEKIQSEIDAENELERRRQEFFRREKARIDFLTSRRAGEIQIQEEILRGNLAQAAILQVEQRAASQDFFSGIAQEREEELKEMRNEARQERMADIEFERDVLRNQVEEEAEAMRNQIEMAKQFAAEQSSTSSSTADTLIADAKRAAEAAIAVEEQRIENYLREWQRVTPATEEEFQQHTQRLQDFMTESGLRLQEEINLINADLRNSLAEIDADFTQSVNNQSQNLGRMLENSRFTLQGIYEAVKITTENSLTAQLAMVEGFVDGLSGGFTSGLEMQRLFLNKFEREMRTGFAIARDIALRVLAEEDKWEAAGERAAAAFLKGIKKIEDEIARIGSAAGVAGASAGITLPRGVQWQQGGLPLHFNPDRWPETRGIRPSSDWSPVDAQGRTAPEIERDAAAAIARDEAAQRAAATISTSESNLSPAQRAANIGFVDMGRFAGETPEAMRARLELARRQGTPGREFEVHPDFLAMAQREFPTLNIVAAPRGAQLRNAGGPNLTRSLIDPVRAVLQDIRARQAGYTSYHTGGFVGDLKSDEVPAVLQKGEYVIRRSAVASLGTDFLDSINGANAMFSAPANPRLSMTDPTPSNQSVETNYHLNFKIDGGNIDEQKLAQKVMFEIKKVERSSGGGRRVMS